ncbi:MAG: hypothetical protein Q7T44_12955 [Parvibaculum sp.]|nr:hypothetical protein [Parvibaculum sp.]
MEVSFLGIESSAWAAIAAIASSISAFAAYRSASAHRKVADADIIEKLNSRHDEFDRRLNDARNAAWDESGGAPHPWNFAVIAWFNHVEFAAHLYNDKLIGRSARKFVEPVLIEWLRTISSNQVILDMMLGAISGPTTYAEIQKFTNKHRRQLQRLKSGIQSKSS